MRFLDYLAIGLLYITVQWIEKTYQHADAIYYRTPMQLINCGVHTECDTTV